jgi:aryl-alcohol dehydrogenase-like predicted oxidoreductase
MEYRNLGSSGLKVSLAGLGCNNFGVRVDEDATRNVVKAALDLGITLFDTSDSYGATRSEVFLGRALAGHRHEAVIATKFGSPLGSEPHLQGASRRRVMYACEESLRRLGTDYIDLYQLHFPDPSTPLDETLAALDDLVRQGKVRYIGSSNLAGWQIVEADHLARQRHGTRFVSAQNEWSLLQRDAEREVVPACAAHGIGILPYFPLTSGLLTGKYRRGEPYPPGTRFAGAAYFQQYATDVNFGKVERLTALAEERGHSILELALSWLAAQPTVSSVIAGATSAEQVAANAGSFGWTLTDDDKAAVEEALAPPAS